MAHIQNRMWMKLGNGPADSSLPPRFDRLYHPTELSHFDKFFARPWATPSRLSHDEANHHQTSLDGEIDGIGMTPRKPPPKESRASLFEDRVQSSKARESRTAPSADDTTYQSLDEFIKINGFNSKSRATINQLLKAHNKHGIVSSGHSDKNSKYQGIFYFVFCFTFCIALTIVSSMIGFDKPKFIGSLQEVEEPSVKYIDYGSKHTMPRRGFRPGAREEFSKLLSDTTLDSNDVKGIRKVSGGQIIEFSQPFLSLTNF